MKRLILLALTHGGALAVGFALGIYLLPILTAPKAPDAAELQSRAAEALFTGDFTRDLPGSDFLHWGEGRVSVTATQIVHEGRLSPGPDYKLYLTDSLVTDEASFLAVKDSARLIGDVKTFDGFLLGVPEGIDTADYGALIVWCEAFGEFITAAAYQD